MPTSFDDSLFATARAHVLSLDAKPVTYIALEKYIGGLKTPANRDQTFVHIFACLCFKSGVVMFILVRNWPEPSF